MFENYKTFETTLAGRPLVIETGKVAQLANGSPALVRYGETVVPAPPPRLRNPGTASISSPVGGL